MSLAGLKGAPTPPRPGSAGLVPGNCVSNVAWTAGNFPQLASDALSIVGDCSGNQTERFETSDDPLRQFNGAPALVVLGLLLLLLLPLPLLLLLLEGHALGEAARSPHG